MLQIKNIWQAIMITFTLRISLNFKNKMVALYQPFYCKKYLNFQHLFILLEEDINVFSNLYYITKVHEIFFLRPIERKNLNCEVLFYFFLIL